MSICFDHLWRQGFFIKSKEPVLSSNSCIVYKKDPTYSENPIFFSNYNSHNVCFIPDNTAMYSVSVIDIKTDLCFLLNYKIKPPPNRKIIPMIDL